MLACDALQYVAAAAAAAACELVASSVKGCQGTPAPVSSTCQLLGSAQEVFLCVS
jgi:hypothetical protein